MTLTAAPIASEFHQRHAAAKRRIQAAGKAHEATKRAEATARLNRRAREAKVERMKLWVPKRAAAPSPAAVAAVQGALDTKRLAWPRSAIRRIQRATCDAFNCTSADLLSGRKAAPIVLVRHTAMWLCRKLTTGSYPQIAKAFKRADHTSVIHAIKATDQRMAEDPKLRDKVLALEATLAREVGVEC